MAVTQIHGEDQIQSGTIKNAQVHASAAIATSKLADGALFIKSDGSVAFGANQSFGNFLITNLAPGVSGTDAVNLNQLQAAQSGLNVKAAVRVATTTSGTLATSFENGDTVDGVTLVTGDRILIKDQGNSENGIYTVNASGAPTRATDADHTSEWPKNVFVFVSEGTTNADSGWVTTNDTAITLGSTTIVFTQFTGAGAITAGAGLTKTGNTIDVVSGNTGIVANANDITLTLKSTPGLQISSGLGILLGSNSGLNLTSGLAVDSSIAGNGLTFTSGVIDVVSGNAAIVAGANSITLTLDSSPGLQTTSGLKILLASNSGLNLTSGLAVDSSIAGNGLTFTTGVLAVVSGNSGIVANANDITLTLSATDPGLEFSTGLRVKVDGVTIFRQSTGLTVNFGGMITSGAIARELMTGSVNGSNTVFTVSNNFIPDGEFVYYNGQLLIETDDYTVTDTNEITTTFAPKAGKMYMIYYADI